MNSRRNLLYFGFLVTALLVLAVIARQLLTTQAPSFESGVQIGSNYRLSDVHEGDLVVISDTIVLEAGSRVSGSASLIGDTITTAGVVEGDLTMLGSQLHLESGSRVEGSAALTGDSVALDGLVDGDVRVAADSLTIAPDAVVSGIVTPCVDSFSPSQSDALTVAECDRRANFPPFDALIGLRTQTTALDGMQLAAPGSALLLMALSSLTLVGFSTLTVTMFPRQISHIEEAMCSRPRQLIGAGFATFLLIVGLCAVLVLLLALLPPLGLVLLPVYVLLGVALLVLVVAGMVTMSLVLGNWLVGRFSRSHAPPLLTVIVGSLALSALMAVIVLLPYGFLLGAAALALVSSVGVGAALFTRLGTRPLRRSYFIQG